MDGKGYGIALLKWHDLGAALHARPLLGEHELATGEIVPRLREQDRNLDWEREIAVEVLEIAVLTLAEASRSMWMWLPMYLSPE